jgi:hypothetical protein
MKRSLILIATLGLLVFGLYLLGGGGSQVRRSEPTRERDTPVDAPTQTTDLADVVHTTSSEVEALREPTAAPQATIAADARALAGRTFADVIVLREGIDGPLVRDYEVLVIAGDGAVRRVRSDAAIEERDLDPAGMLVLLREGACPRFVAAEALAEQAVAVAPLELRVLPSATIVVHVPPSPPGSAVVESVALHADGATPIPRARCGMTGEMTPEHVAFQSQGTAWRRLADEATSPAERAALLRECRSGDAFDDVAGGGSLASWNFLLPWVARLEVPHDASEVRFEEVPSIARLSVVVECDEALDHDGERDMTHRQRQARGGCLASNVVLERGEVRHIRLQRVVRGRIIGSFPGGARAPFGVMLALVDIGHDGNSRSEIHTQIEPPSAGGAFAIDDQLPAHYRFSATWHDESGERHEATAEFDLAPSSTHDIGELSASSEVFAFAIDLVVDGATAAAGVELAPDDFAVLVGLEANESFGGAREPLFRWCRHGEVIEAHGLGRGYLALSVVAAVPSAEADEDAGSFARRHGLSGLFDGAYELGDVGIVGGQRSWHVDLPAADVRRFSVPIAARGTVAVDVFVPSEFVRPGAMTQVWFLRGEGELGRDERLAEWRGDASGGGFLSGTFALPVGEWNAFVRLTLPPTEAEPRHGVALGRVLVEAGATRPLAVELVRGATLDFPASAALHLTGLGGGLELRDFPDWLYTPFSGVAVGERVLVPGLLPDTDHRSTKGDVVRTGPPGSATVVE